MITIARYLPLKVPRQAFRGFAIPGKQAIASRPLTVNRKPTLEKSLSASFDLLIRQHPIPLLRAINLRVLIRDKDDSLRRDAALVVGNPSRLAIRLLRLLYRHTHRHSDIDMQLLSSRILQMQQLPFPYRVAAVQLTSLLQGSIHIIHIIHINGSLKEEAFRIRILTGAVIISESVIMNRTDRQLSFQPLACLLHRLFITSIYAGNCLLPTYLRNHTLQPRLCYQVVIDIQGLGRIQSSHIALACRIQSHYLYCSHAISSLKCLALPFISIISL